MRREEGSRKERRERGKGSEREEGKMERGRRKRER